MQRDKIWLGRAPAFHRTRSCHSQSLDKTCQRLHIQHHAASHHHLHKKSTSARGCSTAQIWNDRPPPLPCRPPPRTMTLGESDMPLERNHVPSVRQRGRVGWPLVAPLSGLRREPPATGPRGIPWWTRPPPSESTSAAKGHPQALGLKKNHSDWLWRFKEGQLDLNIAYKP